MSDQENNTENQKPTVDLSGLSNLQFSTAWTPSSNSGPSTFGGKRDFKSSRPDRKRQDGGDFKKRPFKKDSEGERKFGKQRPNFAKQGEDDSFKLRKKFDKNKRPPFNPTMEVLFYPDDAPFNKLADIMKASKRTYQLFDIAQLVLEKPERFIILAKNLPDAEKAVKPLYCAQPLNIPYDDEQAAKAAAVEYYLDELFTVEQIDAEPPKGSFQVVNKCSITGDLLGAPNWHRYNEYLREYHHRKFPNKPFEEFTASIESVRDEKQINAWLEQMKKRDVYKLKNPAEGENDIFDTREAAANYISAKMGADLVRTYEQVRMRGANLAKLPHGRIRRNIEEMSRRQRRFPIVTANNLRGRLRRSGFVVYKRGSNGFAFVSSVRRKFLFEGDTLSETPQKLFDFITRNPGIIASEVPYKFNSITPPANAEKPKSLSEENKCGEASEKTDVNAVETLDDNAKALVNAAWSELLWLISEGYVVEYADSTLQANPYLPRPKDKSQVIDPETHNFGAADEPIDSPKKHQDSECPLNNSAEKETVAEESRDEAEEVAQEKQDEAKEVPVAESVSDPVEKETIAEEARDESEEIAQEKQDETK